MNFKKVKKSESIVISAMTVIENFNNFKKQLAQVFIYNNIKFSADNLTHDDFISVIKNTNSQSIFVSQISFKNYYFVLNSETSLNFYFCELCLFASLLFFTKLTLQKLNEVCKIKEIAEKKSKSVNENRNRVLSVECQNKVDSLNISKNVC